MKDHAQTTIYCAVSEEMEGVSGRYLSDCRVEAIQTTDKDTERLWEFSLQLTGLKQ